MTTREGRRHFANGRTKRLAKALIELVEREVEFDAYGTQYVVFFGDEGNIYGGRTWDG
jgi:hypothetical protein